MCEQMKEATFSAKEMAEKIIESANENEMNCEDGTCLLVYSILRDCGYQIKRILGEENPNHCNC